MTKPSNEVIYRSKKKIYKTVVINIHKEYDSDILARLETEPSKQGFFKAAAREKIQREAEDLDGNGEA